MDDYQPKLKLLDIYLEDKDDNYIVALSKALKSNTVVTSISFHGDERCTVSIKGWKTLFRILQIHKTIEMLSFTTCHRIVEWENLAPLLATMVVLNNHTIKELSFDVCGPIRIKGICTIVETLCIKPKGCTLTSLYIAGLDDVTVVGVNESSQLATLVGTLLQQKSTKINELCLGGNSLCDDFAEIFAGRLKHNSHLQILNLDYNRFTYYSAKVLASALLYNQPLIELDLSFNRMGKGVTEITTALRYHPTLKRLLIDHKYTENNIIVPETVYFLKYNEVLETLSLFTQGTEPSHIDSASVLAMLDYNDTLFTIEMGNELLDLELLEQNRRGERTAPKKGLLRRQDIYMWCYKDWISKRNRATTNKRLLLVAETAESSKITRMH